jgi:hypothetical protein
MQLNAQLIHSKMYSVLIHVLVPHEEVHRRRDKKSEIDDETLMISILFKFRDMSDESISLFNKKYAAHPLSLNLFNKWLRECHIG